MKPLVVVAGSLNMDFVLSVETLPAPGQTVLGSNFQMLPGGKGANQACACGKLARGEVAVRMAGRVGYDLFADHLKASLAAAGVDVSAVHATKSQPTGVAMIWVDRQGRNSIVVAPGANAVFTPADLGGLRSTFRNADYALFQLETPLETVSAGLQLARQEEAATILDPAPARTLDAGLLSLVDILTPNETEACMLLGSAPRSLDLEEAARLARELRTRTSVGAVLLKLGEKGCLWWDGHQEIHAPAFPVQAVDTTAAGDTFNGALAIALAEDRPLGEALRFANAAAALSTTKAGAQASIPSRAEVDAFLQQSTSLSTEPR
ncbi:MAG: ribokinase [Bryobacteraceae bacterium]|nr:ribokinase [Bryobacteraceae bacterium]MDW8379294.1 ribokinase [Bryobacterales bacterium]